MTSRKRSSRAKAWLLLLGACALVSCVALVIERSTRFGKSAQAEPAPVTAIKSIKTDDDEHEEKVDSQTLDKKLDALERELAGGDGSPAPR